MNLSNNVLIICYLYEFYLLVLIINIGKILNTEHCEFYVFLAQNTSTPNPNVNMLRWSENDLYPIFGFSANNYFFSPFSTYQHS